MYIYSDVTCSYILKHKKEFSYVTEIYINISPIYVNSFKASYVCFLEKMIWQNKLKLCILGSQRFQLFTACSQLKCDQVCCENTLLIRYSSSLTLHSYVKTHVLSPAFCVELLNISQVIMFYSQFWHVHACIFFKKCTCVHEHTLHEYTQNWTSTLTR